MTSRTFARRTLGGLLAALFLGAGMAGADVAALNRVEPERGFSRVWRAYPDMDARFARESTPRTLAQIRSIAVGNTKQQLVRAAGQPVTANPDGSWNFHVNLPIPQRNRLVCQLRVEFDAAGKVTGTVWRRPQCADLVTGRQ